MTFTSIFPACYSGRWPHIHFEVYPSLEAATDAGEQDRDLADRAAGGHLHAVYATAGYEQSVRNMAARQPGAATWSSARTAASASSATIVRLHRRRADGRPRGRRSRRSPGQPRPPASGAGRARGRSAGRARARRSARRPLCSYSLVIHGRRPRICRAVSSAKLALDVQVVDVDRRRDRDLVPRELVGVVEARPGVLGEDLGRGRGASGARRSPPTSTGRRARP